MADIISGLYMLFFMLIVVAAYPHHHFDEDKLTSRRAQEKDQRFIEVLIRKLFPNYPFCYSVLLLNPLI